MNVYVIKNQQALYLNKQHIWVSAKEVKSVYRTEHRDEALNTLIEVNAKDIAVRGEIIKVVLNENKQPELATD
ncbi:MAG: hypothetical protein KAG18_00305 [Sinobacterium sp.]|nr:hypothetical protein [Sinobacterium sp.]